MKRIYVSSTHSDLQNVRHATSRVILQMGHRELVDTDSLAKDDRPTDFSLRTLDDADIFIGIYAWHYGYVPRENNPEAYSITELEYNHAKNRGVRCLCYVVPSDAPWTPSLMDGVTGEGEAGMRIRKFRERISKDYAYGQFRSPDELASLVSIDLARLVERLNLDAEKQRVLAEKSRLRIFLCHSSQDKSSVRALRTQLLSDGYSPWLDEIDILPGQDWKRAIGQALKVANIVLVCLSAASTSKIGFVQKEIRDVLDLADLQPDGDVFLIPIKLEQCEVPERLARWQWVDYFASDGYAKLLRTLQAFATKDSH